MSRHQGPANVQATVRGFWALSRQLSNGDVSNGDVDSDPAWRVTGKRASQQLRVYRNIGVSLAVSPPLASLASFA